MQLSDLVLSIGPALLAIVLQYFSFPSEKRIEREAREIEKTLSLARTNEDFIKNSLVGAVTLASLPITFMSFGVGVFTLFFAAKREDSLTAVVLILFVAAFVGIAVCHSVSGFSFYWIAFQRLRRPWRRSGSNFLSMTRKRLIDYTVYGLNGLLIVIAVVLFLLSFKGKEAPEPSKGAPIAHHP